MVSQIYKTYVHLFLGLGNFTQIYSRKGQTYSKTKRTEILEVIILLNPQK